jgi:undecaprenyl-diphosphatase
VPVVHAVVLGITQGLSEFLPISSSGHLELVPWLFRWNDFGGDEHVKQAFDVALHMGTFVGALAYFWGDVAGLASAALRSVRERRLDHESRRAWLLLLSTVPAALLGAVFGDTVAEKADAPWLIAVMLIVFGGALLFADRLPARRAEAAFGPRDAVLMGIAQAAALQPGVSRSGVTISAGRGLGFDRDSAARLSFLMSLPIIGGAGLYEALKLVGGEGLPSGFAGAFIAGMVAAAITGFVAVWGTLRLIRTRSFTPFVLYRVVLGIAVLTLIATNIR